MLGILSLSIPAFGQEAGPDFTVVGDRTDASGRTLSAAVDLSGLNLTTRSGQFALTKRIWRTASDLCMQLHLATDCVREAINGAEPSRRAVVAKAQAQQKAARAGQRPILASAGPALGATDGN